MKKFATIISIIISLAIMGSTVDSRYGKASTQKQLVTSVEMHKLEHQENMLEERLWDLEDRQEEKPTKSRAKEIKKTKSRLDKVRRKIDKELSIK